jgi:glycerol kinase
MLFNLDRMEFDPDLLQLMNIPIELMGQICDSSQVIGHTAKHIFDKPIPIAGVAGDQQAALFGQGCFSPGLAKNTYGTGCFMLLNVGKTPAHSHHRMLSTVAWKIGAERSYALEGSVFIAGAVTQWLRDGLKIISAADQLEPLAETVADNGGIYMVPAFAGLGAPHWDAYARGCIFGITRGTTDGHFARAAIESIAYQVADVLDAMRLDSNQSIAELRVDGGACKNNLLLQFQADLLGATVVRPKVIETTALGAAYLAGLAVGFWKTENELLSQSQIDKVFEPTMSRDQAMALRKQWDKALGRSKSWEDVR